MNSIDERKPNNLLRHERESRGWTLRRVADELYQRCGNSQVSDRGVINADMVSRWELGKHRPSRFWQEQLSLLYGKSLEELGFVEPLPPPERLPTHAFASLQSGTVTLPTHHQAIDFLFRGAAQAAPEEWIGVWLALQASDLAVLFQEGWSVDDILTSLQALLKGVQALSNISRRALGRKLLEFGTAAVISGITIPTAKHVSAEERMQLQEALGTSLVAGWKLFHTAGNAQVLAVGQAQLYLLQQNHTWIPSRVRAGFYTSVYNLIGKASHFQGRYEDALEAHQSAHVAALATGDPWNVAQSLICQADSYQAIGQHAAAIDAIEEAMRLLGHHAEEELLRSQAQLLASWVENALDMKEWHTAEEKLEEAAALLERLPPHEQFDRASWLQLAGKHAFAVADYRRAVEHLETALREVPPTWLIRRALILLPLVAAHTWERDREASLATSEAAFAAVKALNAPTVTQPYRVSLQGLLEAFPHDSGVQAFVAGKLAQL